MHGSRLPTKILWILTATAAIGIVIVAVTLEPRGSRVEVMLTAVLAVATLLYTATTYDSLTVTYNSLTVAKDSLTVAENTLHASVRPHIVPSLTFEAFSQQVVDKPRLRITNVGRGPAISVKVSLILEPGAMPIPWVGDLAPGQRQDFQVPLNPSPNEPAVSSIVDLVRTFQYLRVTGECIDTLGNPVRIEARVDIRDQYRDGFGPYVVPPSEDHETNR